VGDRALAHPLALLAAVLAATVALALPPAAHAAALAGATYDAADGDQKNQGSAPNDWQALSSLNRVTTYHDPNGADSTYIGGTKEEQPSGWAFSTTANGVTPGKSNVLVGWSALEPTASTSFLYLGFKRAGTTGNSFLTFELNQKFSSWRNSVGTTIPCRTDGDLLVAWQAGSPMVMKVYRWLGSGGPPACPDGAFGTFTGSTDVIAAGHAQGAINASNSQKDNYLSPTVYGSTFPLNAFGEAAINLPAVLGSMGASPCAAFVGLQVHSRSSEQISSALQDFVAAQPVRVQSCSVSGTKFNDLDADGTRDAGEPGLGGVRFYLDLDNDDQRDDAEPTAVSDSDGGYYITDVPPGTYTVREELSAEQAAAGWTCSAPASCEKSVTQAASGGNTTGHDFGNWEPARVTGTKFQDTNRNGTRDYGERGVAGVTVFADANGNAVLDAGERSSVTGADGGYEIGGMRPGTYTVREVSPAGYSCTTPSAGCAYSALTLTSGQASADRDFGNAADASVAGRVYRDRDADGTDDSDPGLQGWVAYVDYNANGARDAGETSATTDATGGYTITAVNAGTYRVRLETQSGWTCSAPAECSYRVTFEAGSAAGAKDFGAWQPGSVSGTKFTDSDRDGVMDAGEAALSRSFWIFVDYDGDRLQDAAEPATTVGAGGAYTITGVRPGTWGVRESPTPGWLCTADCGGEVTIVSGATVTGLNVGNVISTMYSGYKFEDADADGFRDFDEIGLSGWRIYADVDRDGVHDADEPSTLTRAGGSFTLADLPNGVTFDVRFVNQDGWTCLSQCSHSISFASTGGNTGGNFGSFRPGSAGGRVLEDRNADGAWNVGDDVLSGFVVYADTDQDGEKDAGEPTAATDEYGRYTITDLAPGVEHSLRLAPPAGWSCSDPSPCARELTLSSGGTSSGNDFRAWRPATVSGQLFDDRNRDGAWSVGEFPLGGRHVFVDLDADNELDSGEPSTLTDPTDGGYTIGGIRPRDSSTYSIRAVPEAGWVCTGSGCNRHTPLYSGQSVSLQNFGHAVSLLVSGTRFEDVDADGVKDAGEPGVGGATVWVDYDGDGALDAGEPSATTIANGFYTIIGVRAGAFRVRSGGPAVPASTCSFPSSCSYAESFEPGRTYTDRDFGAWRAAGVSGLVYGDADRDGAKDAGESGLGGYVVYADSDNDEIRDSGELSTTTATTGVVGSYQLIMKPGPVTIRQEPTAGNVCVSPSGCGHPLTLSSGVITTGKDFGNAAPAGLVEGVKFGDHDGDGVRDSGEPGLPGFTIYVDYDGDGTPDAGEPSSVSTSTGDYRIDHVNPGSWSVREVQQAGWTCSAPAGCVHAAQSFAADSPLSGRDFGNYRPGSISGVKFNDLDHDGVRDSGEPEIGGTTVYVDTNLSGSYTVGEPSAVTGIDGAYTISGLSAGTHTVREVTPAGWTCSAPAACAHTGVSVGATQAVGQRDFANWTEPTISGQKFEDMNGNGEKDAGEPGVQGFAIYADANGDGDGADAGEGQAVTAADGTYRLAGLTAGTAYELREVAQAGWTCAVPSPCRFDETLTASQIAAGRDFGAHRAANVSGVAYEDSDADGVRESGEPRLDGWRIYVDRDRDGSFDAGEPASVTGADGAYSIANLTPDGQTYDVRREPAGAAGAWSCSEPASACRRSFTVVSNAAQTGDFGSYRKVTIAGTVYGDRDGDGDRGAGETGLSDWTVKVDPATPGTAADDVLLQTAADGTWSATELRPGIDYRVYEDRPAGWACTEPLSCEYAVPTRSGDGTLGGRDFGNFENGRVTIRQVVAPNEPPTGGAEFDFTPGAGIGGGAFTLRDAGERSWALAPGTYAVEQAVKAGYALVDVACAGDADSAGSVANRRATFRLTAGEDVTCTFSTERVGRVEIEQQTLPDGTAESLDFDAAAFPGSADDSFSLADGQVKSVAVTSGRYPVKRVTRPGFSLSAIACDNASPVSVSERTGYVDVEPGEVVRCTFTDSKHASLQIVQDSAPDDAQDFAFVTLGWGLSPFTLDDDADAVRSATRTFSGLAGFSLGAKSVTQTVPAGWDLTAIACTGDDDAATDLAARRATVDLEPGEDVVCEFEASKRGRIEIEKQTLPDGASGSFDFTADLPGTADDSFSLSDGGLKSVSLAPGSYPVTQAARGGFDLASLTCDDGSSTSLADRRASVDVAPGEVVRCVFTDAQRASVTVRKATDPAESPTTGTEFELTPGAGLGGGAVRLRHDGTRTWSVAPGTYTVDEAPTDGYELSGIACQGDSDSSGDAPTGRATFRVAAGEDVTCTFTSATNGSIAGTSFEDADADGQRDQGEPGARSFSVFLDLDDDGAHDTGEPSATSAADGSWSFDRLAPGTYVVRQAARSGWTCSTPADCALEVEPTSSGATAHDFGAWRSGRILGTAFEDLDRDGRRDDGEPTRSRRTLYLDADGDATRDANEQSTASGVDGTYSFDGLRPGAWTVRELLPEGWHCSAPDPCAHTVALRSGNETAARDFGAWRDAEPEPPVEPEAPRPPTIGSPTLSPGPTPGGGEDPTIGREHDPETGGDIYLVSKTGPCQPLRLDIPIDADPGSVLEVRLVFRPAGGGEEETILLSDTPPEPADGIWSGTIDCARDGDLELIVRTAAGETHVPVGEVVLIDPSGTIYDEELYASLSGDGADPEAARCGSALSGAVVTLQRRVGGEFQTVAADDPGIAPNLNPQESDADGSYRWDVSAGQYRVRVVKEGYYPTVSRTVKVPPPVLDLHVAMTRRPGTPAPAVRECGKPEEPEMDGDRDGCVLRPVNARVRGRYIDRVVFDLDGRRLRTVSRPDREGVFGVTVQRRNLSAGKHVLRAKVFFKRRAHRRPELLTLRFTRCLRTSKPKQLEATPRPDCGARRFLAWVRGDRIRRVAFGLDGDRLRTVSVADWRGRYGVTIDPAELATGRHVVTARIEYVASSGLRPQTVRLRFTKCS
jgi:hypothetical protein